VTYFDPRIMTKERAHELAKVLARMLEHLHEGLRFGQACAKACAELDVTVVNGSDEERALFSVAFHLVSGARLPRKADA
jgi:hypothetical protein